MKRIESIDFTRGVVMVIMALDHVRDMMHNNAIIQNPTDLKTTTPALFFTRWITHLCAPTFVFLAGVSAYLLLRERGAVMRNFLFKRGVWLIVIEFTIVNFALWFDLRFRTLLFEVIAAIGFGFIALSLISRLQTKTIGIIGATIVLFHNLIQFLPFENLPLGRFVAPFFIPTPFQIGKEVFFVVGYPPIPWLGIMLLGYAVGSWFYLSETEMQKGFLKASLIFFGAFVVIRFLNFYGDFAWSKQKDIVYTFMSFIDVTKYPPSLLFVLSMLGIMFAILSYSSNERFASKFFITYGKVPLFYFVIHLYIIHILTIVLLLLQGFQWSELNFGAFAFGRPKDPSGIELWAVYVVWMCVVAFLYFPCLWYARFKTANKQMEWLKYF